MPFNHKKFEQAQYQPRTQKVSVPGLRHFFGEGEEPVFIVRNLTSSEAAGCADAERNNSKRDALIDALSESEQRKIELKEIAGIYNKDDVHPDTAVKLEMVQMGCVEPPISLSDAVKLAEHHNLEFQLLAATIGHLSKLGSELVKHAPSGENPK